jgi:signal transduction histidine kinase
MTSVPPPPPGKSATEATLPPAPTAAPLPEGKSLRRRLFGSHLLVMVVALAVLLVGVLFVSLLFELVGEGRAFGRASRESEGPFGLLVGLTAAAVAAGLVSWRMSRRLAEPLEAIGEATRSLAAGRYDVQVPGADTVELDALASDVNGLAHELRTTEERRLRLIGDVAHELRNPLSTVEGTMEALLDGVVEPNDDTFTRIGREAARLRRLADDLSSLSSAGELANIEMSPVDLGPLATHVVAQLEPQAVATGLSLTVTSPVTGQVMGDRDRLTQVLMNVIGNAVQYTDSGSVVVSVGADGSHVVVTVQDTGRGLAPDDQTRIFERFHRVDDQFTDGTGVGLAISKLIVEAHNGTITASSPGLEQGTTLRIELPAS